MTNKLLFCVIVTMFTKDVNVNYIYRQENETEIYYSRKLTWNDFVTVNVKSKVASSTASAVMLVTSSVGNEIKSAEISCRFYKKESWVDITQKNDYILNHEQRHFDITYIYSKKIMEALKGITDKQKMYEIYKSFTNELNNFHDQYDTETNHSRFIDKQKEWDNKIDLLLIKNK